MLLDSIWLFARERNWSTLESNELYYTLPERYLELNILGYPEKNLMNKLQREVLMLYSYDDDPDNVGVLETLYKGIDLIAKIPVIVSYTYQSKVHHFDKDFMIIHHQNYDYSIAEQILYLLREMVLSLIRKQKYLILHLFFMQTMVNLTTLHSQMLLYLLLVQIFIQPFQGLLVH